MLPISAKNDEQCSAINVDLDICPQPTYSRKIIPWWSLDIDPLCCYEDYCYSDIRKTIQYFCHQACSWFYMIGIRHNL